MAGAIADTGRLVALFDRAERHHCWVLKQVEELDAALLFCEPVLTEAMFLLRRYPKAQGAMLKLVEDGALRLAFRVEQHVGALRRLIGKYSDLPMSLADACIVQMAEMDDRHAVLTLDSDFLVYRKNFDEALRLIYPSA